MLVKMPWDSVKYHRGANVQPFFVGNALVVKQNLVHALDVNEDFDAQINAAIGNTQLDDIDWGGKEIEPNKIYEGKIARIDSDFVVVDIGCKSEGIVPVSDWEDEDTLPEVGQIIKVLVDEEEEPTPGFERKGMVMLSKKKAVKVEAWDNMMKSAKEGEMVKGFVLRKIKGGLLVDIGVPVFLPASQVDVRRPVDISEFVGKEIECLVLKIDEERRNIVVSRRAMIESERAEKKTALLSQLNEGEIRKGIVKNIAEFGAFIDLGGIDGLLHITDMSWGHINHPNELLTVDEEIEVVILSINREKEKISLGLKQRQPSPWDVVEEKYPIGTRLTGTVVNTMNYGAFIKIDEGVEGLVHVSEMSWTKRINHPNEMVNVGDEIECIVLAINQDKHEISLGIKQTVDNPWEFTDDKYPVGGVVKGIVRNMTNYGVFIELEDGVDGLLHVSDMSWVRKITHPNEMLQKGQEVECQILQVDKPNRRIALGMKQLEHDPWLDEIPKKYTPGLVLKGTVTKITNFGVFVSLGDDLEGLLHISELADHKVDNAEDVVKVGDEIDVKILRVDLDERKIALSKKRAAWSAEQESEAEPPVIPSYPAIDPALLRGGVGDSGPLFK